MRIVYFIFCLLAIVSEARPNPNDLDRPLPTLKVEWEKQAFKVVYSGAGLENDSLFVALSSPDYTGSRIVPYGKNSDGSTVFLPFKAAKVITCAPQETLIRDWEQTRWGPNRLSKEVSSERSATRIVLTIPSTEQNLKITTYAKNTKAKEGWGEITASLDPELTGASGDVLFRSYLSHSSGTGSISLQREPREKVRIYQFLPRIFGNTNEQRIPNGTLQQNGSGKFSDINAVSLAQLKAMGITHLWPTGVLQQATATDYSAIGEPADDADLLKGVAGSPYAIKDYYDVCPDYAENPKQRLQEFQDMVQRIHAAGLKVIIDFVPNHVARSYESTVRPELSFGAQDEKTTYFAANNNFYWLTPEAKPQGDGPPLRLPTEVGSSKDRLFAGEKMHGRVTGNNLASWNPDAGSWYETVKLNYGFDFADPTKSSRLYPHGEKNKEPIPDTWRKMDEIISYWQGLGVDGFRADMAHMVPPEFWHWMIARARGRNPQVFFTAEAYDNDPAKVPGGDSLVAEVGLGNVMMELLNAGFDAVYDDATYDKLKEIYDGHAWANDLDQLTSQPLVFEHSLRYAENHDEVRLAGEGHWGNTGMEVGRPVTAILFALSQGPTMLYSGQEVGEPANGAEGFGGDDARTSIFDYWSMPEFTKWVNDKKFDGGGLSEKQKELRDFYARLMQLLDQPAFRNGTFCPLNPANAENPNYGRLPGENTSGHWLYSFIRHDPSTGQKFLVIANLHPTHVMEDVRIWLPVSALKRTTSTIDATLSFSERLSNPSEAPKVVTWRELAKSGLSVGSIPPLTPYFYEITH